MKWPLILLASIILAGCRHDVKPTIEFVERDIPIVSRPEPLYFLPIRFDVVNKENLEQFISENEKRNGGLVFIAIDPRGYENLSINIAELKRYVDAQRAIIVYYEEQVK